MNQLQQKVAIITGASSGIGRAAACLFAQQGARVVVGARRDDALRTLVDQIITEGGQAKALAGDVRSEDYAKALVELAMEEFGGLHVAFNNAGTLGSDLAVTHLGLEQWNQTLNVNLTGAFLGAKYQIPAILDSGGGSIIFTSSFVGNGVGLPNKAAYAASKAGLVGLTQALAVEYGARGVRVNALLPGGVATAMADQFGTSPEIIRFVEGIHALKRRSTPQEIAQSVLYLASDASKFTTGSSMLVDGGVSICKT